MASVIKITALPYEELNVEAQCIARLAEIELMKKKNISNLEKIIKSELLKYDINVKEIYVYQKEDSGEYGVCWELDKKLGPPLSIDSFSTSCCDLYQLDVAIEISGSNKSRMGMIVYPTIRNKIDTERALEYLEAYEIYIDNIYDKMCKIAIEEMNRMTGDDYVIQHIMKKKKLYFENGVEIPNSSMI